MANRFKYYSFLCKAPSGDVVIYIQSLPEDTPNEARQYAHHIAATRILGNLNFKYELAKDHQIVEKPVDVSVERQMYNVLRQCYIADAEALPEDFLKGFEPRLTVEMPLGLIECSFTRGSKVALRDGRIATIKNVYPANGEAIGQFPLTIFLDVDGEEVRDWYDMQGLTDPHDEADHDIMSVLSI